MRERKPRNITIAVTPALYRQTRHIAADLDMTVTDVVRHILENLPALIKRTYPPASSALAANQRAASPAHSSAAPAKRHAA